VKLHLHVKTCYFNEISAGTKTEEYRLANEYWMKRLMVPMEERTDRQRYWDAIVIYNAYKPGPQNQIELPWSGWQMRYITHPHFGPKPVAVFAIKLDLPYI
jgi:hypothetical protein